MARVAHEETVIYLCDGNKFVDDGGKSHVTEVHAMRLTTVADDAPNPGWYTITNTTLVEPLHFCSFNCLFRRLMYDQIQTGASLPMPLGLMPFQSPVPVPETATEAPTYATPTSHTSVPSGPRPIQSLGSMYQPPASSLPASSNYPSLSAGTPGWTGLAVTDAIAANSSGNTDDDFNLVDDDYTERDTSEFPSLPKASNNVGTNGASGKAVNAGSASSASQSSFPGTRPSGSSPTRPPTNGNGAKTKSSSVM